LFALNNNLLESPSLLKETDFFYTQNTIEKGCLFATSLL